MKNNIPSFLLERPSAAPLKQDGAKVKMPFVEKGIKQLAGLIKTGYIQWETAAQDNFFQRTDPRVKLLILLFFVVIVSLKREIRAELAIGAFFFVLAFVARLNVLSVYKRVVFFAFIFGFLVALPSAFNVITKGEIILPVLRLSRSYDFLVYHIPQEIGITRPGAYGVAMLTLRVMNSLAVSFFVLYTTPFPEIIRALKLLRAPDSFLMIITLSYKYIFISARTVEDMHLAKKSRMTGSVRNAEARKWIAGRIAFIFKKTMLRCEDIFKAMLSRGFSDEIKIHGQGKLRAKDIWTGTAFFLIGVLFLWM